eukprot:gene6043-6656_t
MNQLKEAERKANQLVQDARKLRTDRMKEAKLDAEKTVAAYRAEMEASYQDALGKVNNKADASSNELNVSTSGDIQQMSREFSTRKESVEKMLIDWVINIDVKPPTYKA